MIGDIQFRNLLCDFYSKNLLTNVIWQYKNIYLSTHSLVLYIYNDSYIYIHICIYVYKLYII